MFCRIAILKNFAKIKKTTAIKIEFSKFPIIKKVFIAVVFLHFKARNFRGILISLLFEQFMNFAPF